MRCFKRFLLAGFLFLSFSSRSFAAEKRDEQGSPENLSSEEAPVPVLEKLSDVISKGIGRSHQYIRTSLFFKALKEGTITPAQYLQSLVNDAHIFRSLEKALQTVLTDDAELGNLSVYCRSDELEADITQFLDYFDDQGANRPEPTQEAQGFAAKYAILRTPAALLPVAQTYLLAPLAGGQMIKNWVKAWLVKKHNVQDGDAINFCHVYDYSLEDTKDLRAAFKGIYTSGAVTSEASKEYFQMMSMSAMSDALLSYASVMLPQTAVESEE